MRLFVDTTIKESYNYIKYGSIFGEGLMKIKKYIAVIIALLMVISLSACKDGDNTSVTQESTTAVNNIITETVAESVMNTETNVSVESASETISQQIDAPITEPETIEEVIVPTEVQTEAQTESETTELFDDPANWSKKKIIQVYKNAAKKSNSTAKSNQHIALKKISVNDGEYDNVFSFITPIIAKFLESNSTEKDGITGGFENLVSEDVSSAKAYRSGSDTVIEMIMVEQTAGVKEDALSGSVGHAITAVGDISTVIKDLSDRGLPLELSEEETKIYYTNPAVKVTINENGEIISGTWSYTVEISMNNFKAFGQTVEKGSVVMENTITV